MDKNRQELVIRALKEKGAILLARAFARDAHQGFQERLENRLPHPGQRFITFMPHQAQGKRAVSLVVVADRI
jgi:hypothetical protein